ncbi:hypothetical protein [Geobacillus sp. C56-T2]|uniref:hypothetical protein n=1 Tax=Geobacillus sp. C56-T2 TaxID=600773 RepID=UPI0011AA6974|nr:hypothetical protein [Geobacillus sp. C56-T2]NNV06294.1 hypothetical protein [Geobacillus sp. MMMUD3]
MEQVYAKNRFFLGCISKVRDEKSSPAFGEEPLFSTSISYAGRTEKPEAQLKGLIAASECWKALFLTNHYTYEAGEKRLFLLSNGGTLERRS